MSNLAADIEPGPAERVERLFTAFKDANVDPAEFDHEAHVLVAWRYLQDNDLLPAIEKYSNALKTLTRKLGVPGKYHETITWFYMIAVGERLAGANDSEWSSFRAANEDLFAREPSLIQRYYSSDLLMSENARRVFVLPDLSP